MGLFKNRKPQDPRRTLKFFLIVIGAGLVFSIVGKCVGPGRRASKEEKALLVGFDKWAEDNHVKGITDRVVVRQTYITDYLTYVDSTYLGLKRRQAMLEKVNDFAFMSDPDDQKEELRIADSWNRMLRERPDTAMTDASLTARALDEEKVSWYRRLLGKEKIEAYQSLREEMDAIKDAIKRIENSEGYKTIINCKIEDEKGEGIYKLIFISSFDKPDSLTLYSVVGL